MNPMNNRDHVANAQIQHRRRDPQLNKSSQAYPNQLVQMQMRGASLVSHDVIVPGNLLAVTDGIARASSSCRHRRQRQRSTSRQRDRDRHHRHGCAVRQPHSFWLAVRHDHRRSRPAFRVTAMSGAQPLDHLR